MTDLTCDEMDLSSREFSNALWGEFDPETGRHAGSRNFDYAPPGVHVHRPGYYLVYSSDGYSSYQNYSGMWCSAPGPKTVDELQEYVFKERDEGAEFPQFSGAPEGLRVFFRLGKTWKPAVITVFGFLVEQNRKGVWELPPWRSSFGSAERRLAALRWILPVVLVDESGDLA